MKGLLIVLALARGADATSTCVSMARGNQEMFLPHTCGLQVGAQAGLTGLELVTLSKLAKTHKKLAVTLAVVSVGFEGWATQHNLRVGR